MRASGGFRDEESVGAFGVVYGRRGEGGGGRAQGKEEEDFIVGEKIFLFFLWDSKYFLLSRNSDCQMEPSPSLSSDSASSSSSQASLLLDEQFHRVWGKEATFRSFQREVVEALLKGRDGLVIMPTGQGKSLCYQLAGLCLPGITVVINFSIIFFFHLNIPRLCRLSSR